MSFDEMWGALGDLLKKSLLGAARIAQAEFDTIRNWVRAWWKFFRWVLLPSVALGTILLGVSAGVSGAAVQVLGIAGLAFISFGLVGIALTAMPFLFIFAKLKTHPAWAPYGEQLGWIATIPGAAIFCVVAFLVAPLRDKPSLALWIPFFTALLVVSGQRMARLNMRRMLLVEATLAITWAVFASVLPASARAATGGIPRVDQWLARMFRDRTPLEQLRIGPNDDTPLVTAGGERYDFYQGGDTIPRVFYEQVDGRYAFYTRGGMSPRGRMLQPVTPAVVDAMRSWISGERNRRARDSVARVDSIDRERRRLGIADSTRRARTAFEDSVQRAAAAERDRRERTRIVGLDELPVLAEPSISAEVLVRLSRGDSVRIAGDVSAVTVGADAGTYAYVLRRSVVKGARGEIAALPGTFVSVVAEASGSPVVVVPAARGGPFTGTIPGSVLERIRGNSDSWVPIEMRDRRHGFVPTRFLVTPKGT